MPTTKNYEKIARSSNRENDVEESFKKESLKKSEQKTYHDEENVENNTSNINPTSISNPNICSPSKINEKETKSNLEKDIKEKSSNCENYVEESFKKSKLLKKSEQKTYNDKKNDETNAGNINPILIPNPNIYSPSKSNKKE